jgi:DMSO/TMAO reductase YedYZ molybdopterin-dependent catalytic subunit
MNNRKLINRTAFFVCAACFCYTSTTAQAVEKKPALTVTGEVTKPLQLDSADIVKMASVSASVKERDGVTRTYTGVPVTEILNLAGVTMGRQLRGENLAKYLLVSSADGYQVVFSLAELDSTFTDRVVILAYAVDGKPLPLGIGPLRMVVPGEKKPARSSFEVISFVIKYAKE